MDAEIQVSKQYYCAKPIAVLLTLDYQSNKQQLNFTKFCLPPHIKDMNSTKSMMSHQKLHIRHCILYEFQQGKNAAEACKSIPSVLGEGVVSHSTCRFWFRRFKAGDFDVSDRQRFGTPPSRKTGAFETLLDENTSQTQEELAEQLGMVTAERNGRQLTDLLDGMEEKIPLNGQGSRKEVLLYAAYSPDLAPSDYYLFR
uniref:HTH_48 domain-containing protein n=1 Tax=Heterorhabditis bacteriophora TaxID=37862 RepID=A0A1I7XBE6_HETBA